MICFENIFDNPHWYNLVKLVIFKNSDYQSIYNQQHLHPTTSCINTQPFPNYIHQFTKRKTYNMSSSGKKATSPAASRSSSPFRPDGARLYVRNLNSFLPTS